ncbi:MAG: acyl-CoA dehydrogenase family protein, partial [Pseudomonadota bacterium]
MAFVLTEEQQMLRDAATDFTADKLPVSALRALRDSGSTDGYDAATWAEMAEMGWSGVLVPESYGGSEFGYVGLGQVLEAQGATLAATPLLQTALIGASALVLAGSEAQKSDLLPNIAAGELKTALAVDEGAHHNPTNIALSATKSGDGWALSGAKTYVLDGSHADVFIVAARTSGQ